MLEYRLVKLIKKTVRNTLSTQRAIFISNDQRKPREFNGK